MSSARQQPTPTRVNLDTQLLQLTSTRPEVGSFIRKVYDLVHESGIEGRGFTVRLDGDDLVLRLTLR
jgi:hypothetical protein